MTSHPTEPSDTTTHARRVRSLPWLLATAAYSAVTLGITWPLAAHLTSALTHDRGDPALATWILWWDAHTRPLTERWWNAPIFWPVSGAFAFSEHLLGISIVTTPLQWLGASPLLAYNLAFLLSFLFAALAAYGLAYAVTKRHDAAFLCGLILVFNPYRIAQIPHIQVMWVFGMPLALLALHKYIEHRQRWWLVVFAAAWLTLAASNGYYLLFFPVLLLCWIIWFVARRPFDDLRAIATAWILGSLPLLPVLWKYRQIHSAFHMVRGIGEIEFFSADLSAIIAASPDLILWHSLSKWSRPEGQLFPGALALALLGAAVTFSAWKTGSEPWRRSSRWLKTRIVLATLAVVITALAISPLLIGPWQITLGGSVLLSVSSPDKPLSIALPLLAVAILTGPAFLHLWRRRSTFGFYTLGAALMFILSLGPRVRFNGVRVMFTAPYAWLLALPGFSELRAPARFGMLFALCVAVAAALAFDRLTASIGRRARQVLAGAAVLVVLLESWPHMILSQPAIPIPGLRDVERGVPIVELPLGIADRDISAGYRSVEHGHPVVNGWGGYDPPHYVVLRTALSLGDGGVLTELSRGGHPLAVVIDHREEFGRWSAFVTQQHGRQIADDGEHRVYRLEEDPPPPLAPMGGTPLAIQSTVANVGNDTVGRLFDGNSQTAWTSQRPQFGGEQLVVDLGRERYVAGVRLELGDFVPDYPRQLTVDCAGDGGTWETCWSGSAGALALRGVLDNPIHALMSIPVNRNGVRRLRLRQTGADPLKINSWSIAELTVLGH